MRVRCGCGCPPVCRSRALALRIASARAMLLPMELTPDEIAVVTDRERLLAKTAATVKLKGHLEALHGELFLQVQAQHAGWRVPAGFDPAASQIARGESLEGTPYQYMDFPRFFTKDVFFTFRAMLWWGRGVCFAWILKGDDTAAFRRALYDGPSVSGVGRITPEPGIWFGGDPWDWEGFVPLSSVPPEALESMDFLKVGRMLPLTPERLTRDGFVAAGMETFNAIVPILSRE